MKNLRLIAIGLLFFLSITALFGGWGLMTGNLELDIGLLKNTPFEDFFLPGLILCMANGILSIIVIVFTVVRTENYYWFIIFQGLVLIGWLTTEVIYGMFYPALHYPYYGLAICLIVVGLLLKRKEESV